MAPGARFGWFVLFSILTIGVYFFLGMEVSRHFVEQAHSVDPGLVSEFAIPGLLALVISLLFGLWWSGNGWRLAAFLTSLCFGAFAFPVWFVILIYLACWGHYSHCTNAP